MDGDPSLVSVIVSNLNGAPYLQRLVDSLLAQQDVETEIIVVTVAAPTARWRYSAAIHRSGSSRRHPNRGS